MPISKTAISNIRHFGGTYAVIPSSTINLIQNPDSLAMLVWLLDRSEDWIVRRDHLRTRFGLGRDRYDNAMRHLKDLGLVWWHAERDPETGRIIDRVLNVGDVPLESVLPKVGKPTIRETPLGGESDHLPSTDTLPSTDIVSKGRFVIPTLSALLEYAKEKQYTNFDHESFFDFYQSKGWMVGKNKMKDWKAAVRNWNKRKSNANTTRHTKQHNNKGRVSGGDITRQLREQARREQSTP